MTAVMAVMMCLRLTVMTLASAALGAVVLARGGAGDDEAVRGSSEWSGLPGGPLVGTCVTYTLGTPPAYLGRSTESSPRSYYGRIPCVVFVRMTTVLDPPQIPMRRWSSRTHTTARSFLGVMGRRLAIAASCWCLCIFPGFIVASAMGEGAGMWVGAWRRRSGWLRGVGGCESGTGGKGAPSCGGATDRAGR